MPQLKPLRVKYVYFYTKCEMPSGLFETLDAAQDSAIYAASRPNDRFVMYEIQLLETEVGSGKFKPAKITYVSSFTYIHLINEVAQARGE